MIARSGRLGVERRQDVAQVGLGREPDGRIREAEPFGPHPHLCRGLLAGNIEAGFQALAGETCGGLQEQGGLADAGIAADEDRRGRDQPAAEDAVEFVKSRRGARGRRLLRGERRQRDHPALGGPEGAAGGPVGQGRLLDDGVPGAAGFAASRPFLVAGAACRAGERGGGRFRHAPFLPEGAQAGKG